MTPLTPDELPDVKVKPRVLSIDFSESEDVGQPGPATPDSGDEPDVEEAVVTAPISEDAVELEAIDFNDGRTSVEHFAHVCMQVRKSDPFLASLIEQNTNLIEFSAEKLLLATSRNEGESLERAMFLLRSVIDEICPKPIELSITPCDDHDERLNSETLYNRKKRLIDEDNERRRTVAQTHPGVLKAVEVLGAPITDVQTCDRREENG